MNRLGIGLNKNTKNLSEAVNETVDATPEIPEVGTAGTGGGIIFYTRQNADQLTCYEALTCPPLNLYITAGMTYQGFIDEINNTFLPLVVPSSTYAANETPGLTYISNNDPFTVADLTNETAQQILGVSLALQNINFVEGWYAEFYTNTVISAGNNPSVFYKETNIDSEESAFVIQYNFGGKPAGAILGVDLNIAMPEIYLNTPNNPSSLPLIPIVIRKFIVQAPPTIVFMPSLPASPNVFPAEITQELTPQYIAEYNGITSQTLPIIVDRYRTNVQVLDSQIGTEEDPDVNEPNKIRSENIIPGDNSRKISFSSANKQIIVKVTYLLGTKPPNPWYDFAEDEMLYLEANVICYKSRRITANLLGALATKDYNKVKIPETRFNNQRIVSTQVINGQTMYYGQIIFKIDVSNLNVFDFVTDDLLYQGSNQLYTVEELSYDGTQGTYQLMLFELLDLKITSNKRVGSTGRIKYLQTGIVAVPTYANSLFSVGADVSTTFFAPDSPYNTSLKPGVPLMDTAAVDYEFKASTLSNTGVLVYDYPIYNTWGALTYLDTRTGALNANYETINLKTDTVYLDVDVDVRFFKASISSTVITVSCKILVVDENDSTVEEILLNDGVINSGETGLIFTSAGVNTTNIALAPGNKMTVLFKVTSTANSVLAIEANSYYEATYYSDPGAAPPPANPNTIIRTRYNYL